MRGSLGPEPGALNREKSHPAELEEILRASPNISGRPPPFSHVIIAPMNTPDRGSRARHYLLFAVFATLLLGLAGCGNEKTETPARPAPHVVSKATMKPGDPIPAPTGDVVLVIKDAGQPNRGKDLALDMKLLDKMGAVSYVVNDRTALGRKATFSGPLVRDLLKFAQVSGTMINTAAINDYTVDIPMTDADKLPLMLATRADGKVMSVKDYGPTRFVYPTEGYDLDPAVYDPRLIWQLATISVS